MERFSILLAILGNAFIRAAIGGLVSAALATIGLHLSPDAALSVILTGASLAGLGPHDPAA